MNHSDPTTCVRRCADQLQQRWPTVARADLEDTALDLIGVPRWRQLEPEAAAAEWLRQGVAAAA